ncbi:MAG: ribose 5-phosphate isomerase B [Planctomycetota bacterium]
MRIAIGSDHAGFDLKEFLKAGLAAAGHEVLDLGCPDASSVDYPEFGSAVGEAVVAGDAERGVVVCGTGIGISMAANKVPGVRAALVHDRFTTEMSRKHNDANVLALGARTMDERHARELLELWLATAFEGGRHERRVGKINALDRTACES